jgi:hypothetical protein
MRRALPGFTGRGASSAIRFLAVLAVGTFIGCNQERSQECARFLTTVQPLVRGSPTAEGADQVQSTLGSISWQDVPLREYASSTKETLHALSNTLKLQASPPDPEDTEQLVKTKVKQLQKELQGEHEEVVRYCAQ